MRSAITTIMSPDDEAAFLEFVFEDPDVYVIPQMRSPTRDVPHRRSAPEASDLHCMLWHRGVLAEPEVRYIESCGDYDLGSTESLIQWIRSKVDGHTLGAGRIAVATGWKGAPDTDPDTAPAVIAWYKRIRKWIKANFANSFVYASEVVPEVGTAENDVWVGPDAVARSQSGWRLRQSGPPEYSLQYYDPAKKAETLARYRSARRSIGLGTVESLGDDSEVDKRVIRVRLEDSIGYPLPLTTYEGRFSISRPVPKPGDEVACEFQEDVLGRSPGPWETFDIKTLTKAGRDRTLQRLRKSWLREKPG